MDTFIYNINKLCVVQTAYFVIFYQKGRFCVLKLKLYLSQDFTQQGPYFYV